MSFPALCKGKTRDFRYRSIKGFSWVGVEKQSVFAAETQKDRVRESKRNIIRETTEGDGKDYHQAVFDVSNASSSSHG